MSEYFAFLYFFLGFTFLRLCENVKEFLHIFTLSQKCEIISHYLRNVKYHISHYLRNVKYHISHYLRNVKEFLHISDTERPRYYRKSQRSIRVRSSKPESPTSISVPDPIHWRLLDDGFTSGSTTLPQANVHGGGTNRRGVELGSLCQVAVAP